MKKWSCLCILMVSVLLGCQTGTSKEEESVSVSEQAAVPADTESVVTPVLIEETPEPTPTLSEEEKLAMLMDAQIEQWISEMSLEEKVAQLFIVERGLEIDFEQYPVGGFIYFRSELESPEQTKALLQRDKDRSNVLLGIPLFTAVDEEGGTVTRIAG